MLSSWLLNSVRRSHTQSFQIPTNLAKSLYSIHYASTAKTQSGSPAFDHTTDVLVVGSGAAGLTAALRSRFRGLDTLVIEKSDKFGGTSSYSGSSVWIPNNHLQPQHGIVDSLEAGATYIDALVKDAGPASSPERRAAYLQQSPQMAKFLEEQGFRWIIDAPYPDYHSLEPGACTSSRSITAARFDLNELRPELRKLLRTPADWQPVMSSVEARNLFRMGSSLGTFAKAVRVAVFRTLWDMVRGRKPSVMGVSLIAQLLNLNVRAGSQLWLDSGLADLITNNAGEVLGATVQKDGRSIRIRAQRGVMLAAGGFARNPTMRKQYLRQPTNETWSVTAQADTGDAITAGINIGAEVALMQYGWWMPCLFDNGKPAMDVYARSFPHSIIVDQSGRRYFNESKCYVDSGNEMLSRNSDSPAIHSWLIIDSRHRKKYMLGRLLPGITPKSAINSGFLHKAASLSDLATQIGVNEDQLKQTVKRFNGFAESGVDKDFRRGENPYDNVFSDPKYKPNPNLGTIAKPPYYAVKIYPGDIGTKGGLLTDEYGRVVNKEGNFIKGLYAAGNTTASVFGSKYPGPGGTLGPAMTFGYIAAEQM
ncbi:hypothetical protein FOZG_17986 [Fusarium oxysporum Fo47]|uniref:FAD-dependent oxidoreductase 2 FAD-binding domain-containing protein n=1 Tax=Fusarium oxysporum Fo47 TaxID=660027 RepID=W9J926_FUSOX|nr:hypothetical protein FOZG_17986 [Fusarium oxysporum Fo47]